MKRLINISVLVGCIILMASCDKGPQFCVEGTVENAKDSVLILEAMTLKGIEALDSVKLKEDGKFCFNSPAPTNPEFYTLRIGNKRIQFSIDSTETVTFTTKCPEFNSSYTVEGSENCSKIQEICQLQSKLQAQIIALEKNTSMYPGDIADSVDALVRSYKENIKENYIYKAPRMTYAYYAVCQSVSDLHGTYQIFNPLSDREDVKCYAAIATAWDGLYPDADRTIQICNMAIQGMENTAPPTEKTIEIDPSKIRESGIIEIELPDVNSKMHKLSELEGKVVMLDFTVYGAAESAERTRLMRELYNKYHEKGLEIYQVGLDEDTHFWKYSCENLPWVCVHETNGQAVSNYHVTELPTFFLINRDTEIVSRSQTLQSSVEDAIKALL